LKVAPVGEPPAVDGVVDDERGVDEEGCDEELLPFGAGLGGWVHDEDAASPASPIAIIPDLVEVLHI
jgi:hypothetical protein